MPFSAHPPEVERVHLRDPLLGYEATEDCGFLRCLAHGVPSPLVRWHYHDEYELHLILETTGKVFVGDYIGHFQPGHLVLTGPRLPHNWISSEIPPGGVALRDRVIQFTNGSMERATKLMPEFREILPMLEQAKFGIEFFGLEAIAKSKFELVADSRGLSRLSAFFELMAILARHRDFRILSSVQLQCTEDDASMVKANAVVSYISDHCFEQLSLSDICQRFSMPESRFSRFFRRATGNTFTNFVNRLRITKACQLLTDTDRYVGAICYEVGFNNVANFNRRFLELKGLTPTDFRRQASSRFGVSSAGSHVPREGPSKAQEAPASPPVEEKR
jgi:AraC-like DNA-binding protein